MTNSNYQSSIGYLAPSGTRKGSGVFASRAIAAGEVVEVAPVIHLKSAFDQLDPGLQRRVFDWERLASIAGVSALALGYGSMYNHSNPANMSYESVLAGHAIRFTAACDIGVDEELTINYYSGASESVEDLWFEICNVDLVENSAA